MITWYFFSMDLSQSAHRKDLLRQWITAGHQRRLLSASLLRVENKYCRDWLSGREKGLLVELDVALKNYILIHLRQRLTVWYRSHYLNTVFKEMDAGSHFPGICFNKVIASCRSATTLKLEQAFERGKGPMRKQTDLDSGQSISTSLCNAARKSPNL